jgi:hypothetical protein
MPGTEASLERRSSPSGERLYRFRLLNPIGYAKNQMCFEQPLLLFGLGIRLFWSYG